MDKRIQSLCDELEEIKADYMACLCDKYSKEELLEKSGIVNTWLLFYEHCMDFLHRCSGDCEDEIVEFLEYLTREPDERVVTESVNDMIESYGFYLDGVCVDRSYCDWTVFIEDYIADYDV